MPEFCCIAGLFIEEFPAGFGDCCDCDGMLPGFACASAVPHVSSTAPENVATLQIRVEIIGGVPPCEQFAVVFHSHSRSGCTLAFAAVNSTHHLLECRDLTRELPGAPSRFLIQNIKFNVDRAEVLGVIGPSGAGKSTLLRLINRLDEPTRGTVLLDGQDYRSLDTAALRRSIGMVMQRPFLFPGTVAENIAFGPLRQGREMPPAQIESLLDEVGLPDYAARDALTLSGGEAQRVAITRALANEPEVLLLDEPTSALDEVSRDSVQRLLERLIRERHLTCVWVTHSLEQARAMADRILVLEAGRITNFGTPAEVLPAASGAANG